MAFNDGFYWYKNVLTKQLKLVLRIYLSIAIILSPIYLFNNANAGAAEKWTIQEIVYEPNIKVMDVTAKKVASSVANDPFYKARVPVTATAVGSTVASMIRMGLAGAAIYGAVEGVGWIIDNGVVKKPKEDQIPAQYWTWMPPWDKSFNPGLNQDPKCNGINATYSGALANVNYCAKTYAQYQSVECTMYNVSFFTCNAKAPNSVTQMSIIKVNNPDAPHQPLYDPVPNDELGNQIIIAAPEVLPEVYSPSNPAGGPAPTSIIDSLEDAIPTPATDPKGDTTNKPNEDTDADGVNDTYNPEKPNQGQEFSLPAFCEWAVVVCEWYVSYKQDSRKTDNHREKELTFWEKVEDWFDWSKDDSDLPEKDDPLDISDLDMTADKVNLSASSTCPQDSVSFSVMGKSVTLDMPYQPVCDALTFFKPAVLLVGAVASVYIVAGVRTKEEDQA